MKYQAKINKKESNTTLIIILILVMIIIIKALLRYIQRMVLHPNNLS